MSICLLENEKKEKKSKRYLEPGRTPSDETDRLRPLQRRDRFVDVIWTHVSAIEQTAAGVSSCPRIVRYHLKFIKLQDRTWPQ